VLERGAPPAVQPLAVEVGRAFEAAGTDFTATQQAATALTRIGADRWHAAGFTGHRVRVAVIDAGFQGYLEARGVTIPSSVVARSLRADGDVQAGTDHGLRAAEVVARVAPRAQLYLLNFSTIPELAAAVEFAIEQRVEIISFSLGFVHNGPGDGSGPVNDVVSRATTAGIAWVTASGNWAQQHWSGFFRDTNGDSIHEFTMNARDNGHHFSTGDLIIVSLRWDDVWGASCSDYDLELYGPDGALVRASRELQACSGVPVESLQVLATKTGRYAVRIVQAGPGPAKPLDLMVLGSPDRGSPLDFFTPAGSLAQPADHPRAISVGALVGEGPREAVFSSRGPTVNRRDKPNVLAPSGVTATAGGFAGTSAAAPHVAGALALLKQAFPDLDAEALRARMVERAVPAEPVSDGTTSARVLQLGSLAGIGPLLPAGADEAFLVGQIPAAGGFALVSYQGPGGYPLRFAHLLLGGRDAVSAFRFDPTVQRFRVFVAGAPAWVSDLTRLRNGDIVILGLAPPPEQGVGALAPGDGSR